MTKVIATNLVKAEKAFHSSSRSVYNPHKIGSPFDEFRKDLCSAICKSAVISPQIYKVYGSVGDRRYSEVPWVGILDKSITTSATRGIYIVFLFSTDGESVFLSLNQGYKYFCEKYGNSEANSQIRIMAGHIRPIVWDAGFLDTIDLNCKGSTAKGYEAGHIIGYKYDLSSMPSDAQLVDDIYKLLSAYSAIKSDIGSRTFEEYYDYLTAEYSGTLPGSVQPTIPASIAHSGKKTKITVATVPTVPSTSDERIEKEPPVYDRSRKPRFKRHSYIADSAKFAAGYCCEHDLHHESFVSSDGVHKYVESHHLIPMEYQDEFDYSLDVPANIVALCSTCHDQIHYGDAVGKEALIRDLYNKRKARLEKAGLVIDIAKLFEYYKTAVEAD